MRGENAQAKIKPKGLRKRKHTAIRLQIAALKGHLKALRGQARPKAVAVEATEVTTSETGGGGAGHPEASTQAGQRPLDALRRSEGGELDELGQILAGAGVSDPAQIDAIRAALGALQVNRGGPGGQAVHQEHTRSQMREMCAMGTAKVPPPDRFDGRVDQLETWIEAMNDYFLLCGTEPVAMEPIARGYLEGRARSLYQSLRKLAKAKDQPVTWDFMCSALRSLFADRLQAVRTLRSFLWDMDWAEDHGGAGCTEPLPNFDSAAFVADFHGARTAVLARCPQWSIEMVEAQLMWLGLPKVVQDEVRLDPKTGRPWASVEALTSALEAREAELARLAMTGVVCLPGAGAKRTYATARGPEGESDEDEEGAEQEPEAEAGHAKAGRQPGAVAHRPSGGEPSGKQPWFQKAEQKWGGLDEPSSRFTHLTNRQVALCMAKGLCCYCYTRVEQGHIPCSKRHNPLTFPKELLH